MHDKYALNVNDDRRDEFIRQLQAQLIAEQGQQVMLVKWLAVAIHKLGGELRFIGSEQKEIIENTEIGVREDGIELVISATSELKEQAS